MSTNLAAKIVRLHLGERCSLLQLTDAEIAIVRTQQGLNTLLKWVDEQDPQKKWALIHGDSMCYVDGVEALAEGLSWDEKTALAELMNYSSVGDVMRIKQGYLVRTK